MKGRKCPNCGAELVLSRSKAMYECPFCGSGFDAEKDEKENISRSMNSFDEEIFRVERDFAEARRKKQTGKCIDTIIYCMNELRTPEKIESMIRSSLLTSSDTAAEGIKEELINTVRPRIDGELKAGERIIFYKDHGIFSKGKEFTVLTDKRFIFFKKKNTLSAFHTDISTLKLSDSGDCAMWYINGDLEKCIMSMDFSGQLTGAAIALACLSCFDQQHDHERIRLI
ncbi:MAG: transposase [Oscillospiraceae bacterium]|nr:transposase [Oscillospiraceae bacterium]